MVCTYFSRDQRDGVINCHLFSRAITNSGLNLNTEPGISGGKLPSTSP